MSRPDINAGLRYEVDSQPRLEHLSARSAPRFSFAWTVQRADVCAGLWIFYGRSMRRFRVVTWRLNGNRQIANTLVSILASQEQRAELAAFTNPGAEEKFLRPAAAGCCIGPAICQSVSSLQSALFPGRLFSRRRIPAAAGAAVSLVSSGIGQYSISANYIYVHTTHLPWAVDTNLLPGARSSPARADGLPTNGLPFQDWGRTMRANPGLCFADPTHTILQNNQYQSIAEAVYNGGILEAKSASAKTLL